MKDWLISTGSATVVFLLIATLFLPGHPTYGQSAGLRPIAVRNLEGEAGPGATTELRNALRRSNQFRVVQAPQGVPHITGSVEPGLLVAKLESSDGRTLLKQKYKQGDLVQGVRQFADDVVLALTRKPGIATSQVAFSLNRSGRPQIFLCDFDGDNVRQMTRKGINVAPAISPTGTHLAHVSIRQGRLGTLVLTDLTSGKSKPVISKPAHGIEAAFSPDGKRIALSMSEDGGPPDLYIAKLAGLGRRPEPILETPAGEHSPSWSPDGRQLVFSAAPAPGAPPQVFMIDLTKKKAAPRLVPTGFTHAFEPNWSPDGHRIAFVAREGNRHRICVHEVGAGGSRPVAEGRSPTWGADSRHLIYSSGYGISMVDSQTRRTTTLVGGTVAGLGWTR